VSVEARILGEGPSRDQLEEIIAANGLLVLVPSAFLLSSLATAGRFDSLFTIVQAIELVAGATNIALLSLNMRDGLSLRRKPVRLAARAR